MPTLLKRTETLLDKAIAEWAEYERPEAWGRSGKGNLTREWDGSRVTIFRRDGGFHWCLSHPIDGTRFSHGAFPSERSAQQAAGTAAGVAYWYVVSKEVA